MKIYFLDDIIAFSEPIQAPGVPVPLEAPILIKYSLLRVVGTKATTIYNGSKYMIKDLSLYVDVSDIISNYEPENGILSQWRLTWQFNYKTNRYSGQSASDINVWHAYRYKHANFEDYIEGAFRMPESLKYALPMLQSTKYVGPRAIGTEMYNVYETTVLPHMPFIKTGNFNFKHRTHVNTSDNTIYFISNNEAIYTSNTNYESDIPLSTLLASVDEAGTIAFSQKTSGAIKNKMMKIDIDAYAVGLDIAKSKEVNAVAKLLGYDEFYVLHFNINKELISFVAEGTPSQLGALKSRITALLHPSKEYVAKYYDYVDKIEVYYPTLFNNSGWQGDEMYMQDICESILNITLEEGIKWGLDPDQYKKTLVYKKYRVPVYEMAGMFIKYLDEDPISEKYGIKYGEYFDLDGGGIEQDMVEASSITLFNPQNCLVLDCCPAHFYLMWKDRLGGYQCQGFKAKDLYSEDFAYTTTEAYSGKQKHIQTDVKSKFALTTNWLSDKEYPIYESIFVSDYLVLYDSELDKLYEVLVSDNSYTEKTHRNQKNLFKLTINLELDKKERVLR